MLTHIIIIEEYIFLLYCLYRGVEIGRNNNKNAAISYIYIYMNCASRRITLFQMLSNFIAFDATFSMTMGVCVCVIERKKERKRGIYMAGKLRKQ